MPYQRRKTRIVKMVKKRVPWISHLISNANVALDLNVTNEVLTVAPEGNLCTACKGSRMLCGKSSCSIVARIYSYLRVKSLINSETLRGASPPGVFVGRIGYPYVYAGPLVPPFSGDTSLLDSPEKWFGKTIDEIVDFRFRLVRGKLRVDVRKPEKGGRILDDTRELSLAERSVDVELALKSKPKRSFILNDEVQPIGPSAIMEDMKTGNIKVDSQLEKACRDTDLSASEAILSLYRDGVLLSRIQKALSVGAFGVKKRRKLVPTRWSITAVDSIVSQEVMKNVRRFPLINEFRVYESTYLDNRFEILMIPDAWKYEAMEAWYPGTIWNPSTEDVFLFSDWEPYHGRTTYAKMGGCYYAARLAVNEKLERERRQASVIVLREVHPGYIMPVGVWQVRENVRNALKQKPLKFDTMDEALRCIKKRLDIDLAVWLKHSKLLKDAVFQTKLTRFA